jgi:putative MATE family efflux protein
MPKLGKFHFKQVIVLGAPLLVGLISEFLMILADSAMVGRLGTEYLAAIGIASMFGELLWVIVWPMAPGTQTIASRRFGRQKKNNDHDDRVLKDLSQKTGDVLDNAIIVAVAVGLAAIIIALFAKGILSMLLDEDSLIPLAHGYISTLKWLMPLAGIFYAIYGFLAAINQTKVIMVATIGLNLLNILFNYILIFGKFGFPALGIVGAALGTVLAQGLGTLFLVVYILLAPSVKIYGCLQFRSLRWDIFADLFRSTGPIIFQLSIALLLFLYYETIVANIGTLYLAATHIVFTVFVLKRAILGGFAEGGSILVGNALGQGQEDEAVRFAYATELMAILIGAALFVFILLFPENIVRIFNPETELVGVGSEALRFFAVFIFIEAIGFPFEVLFTHNGWGRFVLLSEIITNSIFVVGLTLLLTRGFGFGIYGAWSAFAVYLVFHSLFMFGGFFSKKWLDTQVDSEYMDIEPLRPALSR